MSLKQERTLSIIKPDATFKNLSGAINNLIENSGLRLVAQKMVYLSVREAENFYQEHKGRPFFDELVKYMTSGPVILQVLEGEGAVLKYRTIMGATNPEEAEAGTIRKLYGENIGQNAVHGSDSVASADREVSYFFAGREIIS